MSAMDPILSAAQAERDEAHRKIAELQARIAELDAFLATYSSLAGRLAGETDLGAAARKNREQLQTVFHSFRTAFRAPTIKEMVLNKVERLLQDGVPRHTRVLVDALGVMGVPLRANDKVLQVSKILSTDSRFVADRSRGWTLAAAAKGEGPAGTGPSSAASAANDVPEQETHP